MNIIFTLNNCSKIIEMLGELDKQERKKIKVVFLGDRGVGKSSIITRFITKQFDENI